MARLRRRRVEAERRPGLRRARERGVRRGLDGRVARPTAELLGLPRPAMARRHQCWRGVHPPVRGDAARSRLHRRGPVDRRRGGRRHPDPGLRGEAASLPGSAAGTADHARRPQHHGADGRTRNGSRSGRENPPEDLPGSLRHRFLGPGADGLGPGAHRQQRPVWHRTGRPPPPSPVSAATYTEHGLPWFDLYDETMGTVASSADLERVQSVDNIESERGTGKPCREPPLHVNPSQVRRVERDEPR